MDFVFKIVGETAAIPRFVISERFFPQNPEKESFIASAIMFCL